MGRGRKKGVGRWRQEGWDGRVRGGDRREGRNGRVTGGDRREGRDGTVA